MEGLPDNNLQGYIDTGDYQEIRSFWKIKIQESQKANRLLTNRNNYSSNPNNLNKKKHSKVNQVQSHQLCEHKVLINPSKYAPVSDREKRSMEQSKERPSPKPTVYSDGFFCTHGFCEDYAVSLDEAAKSISAQSNSKINSQSEDLLNSHFPDASVILCCRPEWNSESSASKTVILQDDATQEIPVYALSSSSKAKENFFITKEDFQPHKLDQKCTEQMRRNSSYQQLMELYHTYSKTTVCLPWRHLLPPLTGSCSQGVKQQANYVLNSPDQHFKCQFPNETCKTLESGYVDMTSYPYLKEHSNVEKYQDAPVGAVNAPSQHTSFMPRIPHSHSATLPTPNNFFEFHTEMNQNYLYDVCNSQASHANQVAQLIKKVQQLLIIPSVSLHDHDGVHLQSSAFQSKRDSQTYLSQFSSLKNEGMHNVEQYSLKSNSSPSSNWPTDQSNELMSRMLKPHSKYHLDKDITHSETHQFTEHKDAMPYDFCQNVSPVKQENLTMNSMNFDEGTNFSENSLCFGSCGSVFPASDSAATGDIPLRRKYVHLELAATTKENEYDQLCIYKTPKIPSEPLKNQQRVPLSSLKEESPYTRKYKRAAPLRSSSRVRTMYSEPYEHHIYENMKPTATLPNNDFENLYENFPLGDNSAKGKSEFNADDESLDSGYVEPQLIKVWQLEVFKDALRKGKLAGEERNRAGKYLDSCDLLCA
ncbi:hypothetical protein SK128_010574 [Halocaridina rubra]|uniref:Uncharacterized protein n=1 Tax=Halocaridina rubra TaxID=373956 RepID=A0AAN8XMC9_HALRR